MLTQPDAEQAKTEEDARGATGGQASVTDGQTGEEAECGVRGRSAIVRGQNSQRGCCLPY